MRHIITVDGPAASGKSTVGKLFAQKIGYQFIDSGAFYRSFSLYLKEHDLNIDDEVTNASLFNKLNIQFTTEDNAIRIIMNGIDVTDKLHTVEIDQIVPLIATQKLVREAAKDMQHQITQNGKFLVAGRDIGSEIFPNAPLKFYITASVEERAKRRFQDQKKVKASLTYEEVLSKTKARDHQDSTREHSPLRIPEGAFIIDTTNLSINEVIDRMLEIYKSHQTTHSATFC